MTRVLPRWARCSRQCRGETPVSGGYNNICTRYHVTASYLGGFTTLVLCQGSADCVVYGVYQHCMANAIIEHRVCAAIAEYIHSCVNRQSAWVIVHVLNQKLSDHVTGTVSCNDSSCYLPCERGMYYQLHLLCPAN